MQSLNTSLKAFRVVSWIGILFNLGFVLPALFAPDLLETSLGPGSVELSYLWVAVAGMLLLAASVLYIPAAKDPLTYHVYAWLAVVGRLFAAAFWISTNLRWDLPGPVSTFWIADGAFGVVLGFLLLRGMPSEWNLSAANLSRVVASWKPKPLGNGALEIFRLFVWLGVLVNLTFGLPALFAPAALASFLGTTTVEFTYLWLGNIGMLLVQVSLFFLPPAHDPVRYHVYAWMQVAVRAAGSVFWLWQGSQWNLPGATRWIWLVAAILAVVEGLALQRGLPEEYRFSVGRFFAWLGGLFRDVGRAFPSLLAKVAAAVLLVTLAVVGWELYVHLARAEPDRVFADGEDQFKYGAIGLGQSFRVPLYLWEVLPELCPDLLEGGPYADSKAAWASLGLIYEADQDLPVGFARRQIGYPSVEPTCSLCHTGTYRESPQAPQQLILGGPAHELDLQTFQWFLYDCATGPAFQPAKVLEAIEANHDLGWVERQIYRRVILPFARTGLALQKREYGWQTDRPQQGRGRTDTFNPTKINVFHQPDDGTIGTVDLPAIWNQRAREGMYLHWDGNNNAIRERNYAAAMAVGATPYSVLPDNFKRVTDFVLELPPPRFPWPVDEARAERGWPLYQEHCASCHAFGSEKVGTVTPIDDVGTDRHRLDSFTEALVAEFHAIDEGPFHFDAYRKTNGYSNLPIDGTWARAPYLHNGSVPTLWDLLTPPADRPTTQQRGSDVYDPERMGFVSGPPTEGGVAFVQDTSEPGNAATGHAWGTELSAEEKGDLIEYLKTL